MNRCSRLRACTGFSALTAALVAGTASPALSQGKPPIEELLSPTGLAAWERTRGGIGIFLTPDRRPIDGEDGFLSGDPKGDQAPYGIHDGEGGGGGGGGGVGGGSSFTNAFVNDPCLDPSPEAPFPVNFLRTVQSETEIAIFNGGGDDDDDDDDDDRGKGSGRLMVAGYNDSYGFDDNRQGLSGFSYSTNGGKLWIDASGLPPLLPAGAPAGTPGQDAYFGDPVVVVDNRSRKFTVGGSRISQAAGTFYYASLYQTPAGGSSLSVNRGRFRVAPQQVPIESKANTRCEGNPALHTIPDPPPFVQERIIWEPPVAAVVPLPGPDLIIGTNDDDFIDKEWLYVNQETGVLYLTYTRFTALGETPIELVRSFDGGRTWTPPSIIVPNLPDAFNQATMPVVTPTGRVIVTWFARTFSLITGAETEQRIETGNSDDCLTPAPCTFGPPVIVDIVNPQGEPLGYNRGRFTILNAPYINVDKGRDDGKITSSERRKSGFGNVYITYFDGRTPLPAPPPTGPPQSGGNPFARMADILLSRSTNNGTTYRPPVKVNDDPGDNSHVFPSVQVNQRGRVFVTWLDRRVDRPRNLLTDTWGDISANRGASFGGDVRITDVSTDWITREDAIPDFGDYNSSEVINFTDFVSIWADGRFPTPQPITSQSPPFSRPANRAATPDAIFANFGDGGGGDDDDDDDDDD